MLSLHPACSEYFLERDDFEMDMKKNPTVQVSKDERGHDVVKFEFFMINSYVICDLQDDLNNEDFMPEPEEPISVEEAVRRLNDPDTTYCVFCNEVME